MSEKHDDGGPAFPMPSGDEPRVNQTTHYNEGMTLLDWFAGQALAGFIVETAINVAGGANFPGPEDVARYVYTYATAMLSEKRRRAAGGGGEDVKYRKKPVVIEARRFETNNDIDDAHMDALVAWVSHNGGTARHDGTCIHIETLEGTHRADVGDWIIRGGKGEFYPCKPDIFEMTYEAVSAAPPSDHAAALEVAREAIEYQLKMFGCEGADAEDWIQTIAEDPSTMRGCIDRARAALARIAQEGEDVTAQDDARRLEEIAGDLDGFDYPEDAAFLRSLATRLAAGPPSAGAVPDAVLRSARRWATPPNKEGWDGDDADDDARRMSDWILSLPAQPAAAGEHGSRGDERLRDPELEGRPRP